MGFKWDLGGVEVGLRWGFGEVRVRVRARAG